MTTEDLIDKFLDLVTRYYHLPNDPFIPHYLKSPDKMTEHELRECNPWKEVAENYDPYKMLYSKDGANVCKVDKEMIDAFNTAARRENKYELTVPAFPWYGNPLTAKVIVLSLNPGYVERETIIAKILQELHPGLLEGYTNHLKSMLTFDAHSFLSENNGCDDDRVTYQDLANLHQCWYWKDRLEKAFVNEQTGLNFEDINRKFAVVEYIGYSSEKYKAFNNNRLLPSQYYTRNLIEYIVKNNKDTVFIAPRNVKIWQQFLGNLWDDERFIISSDYLGQRFTENVLKEGYPKVINAFRQH